MGFVDVALVALKPVAVVLGCERRHHLVSGRLGETTLAAATAAEVLSPPSRAVVAYRHSSTVYQSVKHTSGAGSSCDTASRSARRLETSRPSRSISAGDDRHRHDHSELANDRAKLAPTGWGDLLGISKPGQSVEFGVVQRLPVEQAGGGDQRSRQTGPAGRVSARDQANAGCEVESEQAREVVYRLETAAPVTLAGTPGVPSAPLPAPTPPSSTRRRDFSERSVVSRPLAAPWGSPRTRQALTLRSVPANAGRGPTSRWTRPVARPRPLETRHDCALPSLIHAPYHTRRSTRSSARRARPAPPLTKRLPIERKSGRRVSNPRPLAWEANALPTELRPLDRSIKATPVRGRRPRHHQPRQRRPLLVG